MRASVPVSCVPRAGLDPRGALDRLRRRIGTVPTGPLIGREAVERAVRGLVRPLDGAPRRSLRECRREGTLDGSLDRALGKEAVFVERRPVLQLAILQRAIALAGGNENRLTMAAQMSPCAVAMP